MLRSSREDDADTQSTDVLPVTRVEPISKSRTGPLSYCYLSALALLLRPSES